MLDVVIFQGKSSKAGLCIMRITNRVPLIFQQAEEAKHLATDKKSKRSSLFEKGDRETNPRRKIPDNETLLYSF